MFEEGGGLERGEETFFSPGVFDKVSIGVFVSWYLWGASRKL